MARLLLAVTLLAFVAVAVAEKEAEVSKLKSLLAKIEKKMEDTIAKEEEEEEKSLEVPAVHRSKKAVVMKAKSLIMKARAASMNEKNTAEKSYGSSGSSGFDWSGFSWSGFDWSGFDWSGFDWSGFEWSGDWSGSFWSGDYYYECDAYGADECCLWQTDMCDGWDDCNGWDEDPAHCASVCSETDGFSCSNNRCIPDYWQCDYYDDCENGEDEEGCSSGSGSGSCAPDDLQCDGMCYPSWWYCDDWVDCTDGSDEEGCGKKSAKKEMLSKLKSYDTKGKEGKTMSFDDQLAYALKDFATARKMTLKDVVKALAKVKGQ